MGQAPRLLGPGEWEHILSTLGMPLWQHLIKQDKNDEDLYVLPNVLPSTLALRSTCRAFRAIANAHITQLGGVQIGWTRRQAMELEVLQGRLAWTWDGYNASRWAQLEGLQLNQVTALMARLPSLKSLSLELHPGGVLILLNLLQTGCLSPGATLTKLILSFEAYSFEAYIKADLSLQTQ